MEKVLIGGKVEQLTMNELALARQETDYEGNPKYGVFLTDFINHIAEESDKLGMKPKIRNLDVTDVSFVDSPKEKGVAIYQEKDIRLAVIRDAFVTIDFEAFKGKVAKQDNILSAGIVWTSKGIKVGFGPKVTVCSNMCIMGSNTIRTGVRGMMETMKQSIPQMLGTSEERFKNVLSFLQALAEKDFNLDQFITMVGELNLLRVINMKKMQFDHNILNSNIGDIPLLQGDINQWSLKGLHQFESTDKIDGYTLYNNGTELLKPGKVMLYNLLDNNVAFTDYMQLKLN